MTPERASRFEISERSRRLTPTMSETLLTAYGDEIRVNGQQLASLGSNAGAEMTAILAIMAKDKGGPELEFQVMLRPAMDANFETTSYQNYADGYFWVGA
jgi:acetyl esterase/lipase